tara:strand:+ start:732 stop:1244 length:513 start_codon:yes stop_codon:yes gene_type:complete
MDDILKEALKHKKNIINNMNTVILSTVSEKGYPNASYAPCAVDEHNNFFIYISKLSKHTNNLIGNPLVSIMIIEDESESENIFARKRLTIEAHAEVIKRDSKKWLDKMSLLENKFGEPIEYLKNLTDFYLFNLKPDNGLLVHGFARAFKFIGSDLNDIKYLNEKGHTSKK